MKRSILDYIFSGPAIGCIFVSAFALTRYLVSPVSIGLFGPYHVVADTALLVLCYGVMSGIAVRILLIALPLKPGSYPMDHTIFLRWKLITVLYQLGRASLLPFTPVFARPLVARLFGATIGSNTAIGGTIEDPYLVHLGDDVVLGHNSVISGHYVMGGQIVLSKVTIGRGATIGANVVVYPGAEIGDEALLTVGSVVLPGTKIPPKETWRGNPARKAHAVSVAQPAVSNQVQ